MKKMIFGAILIMMMTMITTGCKASNPDQDILQPIELVGDFDATLSTTIMTGGTEVIQNSEELWTFTDELRTEDASTHQVTVHQFRKQGDSLFIDSSNYWMQNPDQKRINLQAFRGTSTEGTFTSIDLLQQE